LVVARAAVDTALCDVGVAYLVGSPRRRGFRYHCHTTPYTKALLIVSEHSVFRTKQPNNRETVRNCPELRSATERIIAVFPIANGDVCLKSPFVTWWQRTSSIADPNDVGMLDVIGFDTATPNLIADFVCG
jgi:hypothetical protein